jgi:hypothetical protein
VRAVNDKQCSKQQVPSDLTEFEIFMVVKDKQRPKQ